MSYSEFRIPVNGEIVPVQVKKAK